MLFNSLNFCAFFVIFTLLYFFASVRFQKYILLLGSLSFCAFFKLEYMFILLVLSIITFLIGLYIDTSNEKIRNRILPAVIFLILSPLGFFKYYNFFNESLSQFANAINISFPTFIIHLALPVGISFYTFRLLSYLIDIYYERIEAHKNIIDFLIYISFFPTLIAGPIDRAANMLPQIANAHFFVYTQVRQGLLLMLWGFFKKLVIADNIGIIVNTIYDDPTQFKGFPLIISTLFYVFQVYCDFSGYSDIAIGAAKVLGYNLPKNFNHPYCARSLSDFWRRWHMSLYSWFCDYLFSTLTIRFRSLGKYSVILAVLITLTLSGLWHGANWTFIMWGLLHGIGLSVEVLTKKPRYALRKLLPTPLYATISWCVVFSFINLTYLFFRSNNLHDAIYLITNMFSFDVSGLKSMTIGISPDKLLVASLSIIALEIVQYAQRNNNFNQAFISCSSLIRWSAYLSISLLIVVFGAFDKTAFIYFNF
jgi:alginate O-acetyltransferase complex protein AlgI